MKNKKGFTLVELLIVIVIIGILAAVSVAVLQPSVFYGKGRNSRRVSDLEAVRGALEQYYLDNGNQYPAETGGSSAQAYTNLASVLGDYIDSWEVDPTNSGANVYKYDAHQVTVAGSLYWKCYQLSVGMENGEPDYETCGGSLTCQTAQFLQLNTSYEGSYIIRNQDGISLIEILIAVGLLMVVVTALVRLGITTLSTSDASRMRTIAQQLADEGLDQARYLRDTNPGTFFNLATSFYNIEADGDFIDIYSACDPSDPTSIDSNCDISIDVNGQSVTVYRVADVSGDDELKEVTVYVFWAGEGDDLFSSVQTGTRLTRWRN